MLTHQRILSMCCHADITKASSAIGKVFTTIDRIPKIRDAPDGTFALSICLSRSHDPFPHHAQLAALFQPRHRCLAWSSGNTISQHQSILNVHPA